MRAPLPVVVDINVLVDAVVAEPDPSGWKTPPPVRGDPAAMALAALNQGMEPVLVDIALRTGEVIRPDVSVHDSGDWDVNRILELAEAAGALLIISSDADLFEVSPWRGIPVMQPSQLVARLDAMRRRRRPKPGRLHLTRPAPAPTPGLSRSAPAGSPAACLAARRGPG